MPIYFTSPPPVYARNWANGQNLVESTKIEIPITASKKVHRKEKKERKREKKQKNEKTIEHLYLPTKLVCDESEQLERSCLTDEHDKYLSDGSQDSKKRRREASPAVESNNIKATHVTGNPLRIRFVFKKPKEASEVVVVPQVPQEDLVCSTSGSVQPCSISSSVSGHSENLLSACLESDKTAILSESRKIKKRKTSKEARYCSLFDEPAPPSFSMEEDDSNSDDDWLLSARRQEKTSTKSTMNEDMVMNLQMSGESCFPSSQFLPEVGIFSLPYAVLF
ncbi:DNA ligase-like protein [Hirschfeldia incana]|nr:DNA ligase-like protein [Hirschfeldia incana]